MKIFRLADFLELKYRLKIANLQEPVNDIKNNIINAYNLYVNSNKAKEPVLQILANVNEPFSKSIINIMEDLVANIDSLTLVQLFNRINKILNMIVEMKKDPTNSVRSFIHDSIRGNKESERNYREHVKSKFEMVISRLSSILEKQAKMLQKFLPKETNLEGGIVEPQRKELSKDKLLMFSRSPAAVNYGLGSTDILEKVLFYPDLKNKITTLINAVDRGHIPMDGPEVRQAVKDIMESYKQKDNSRIFGEEKP